MAGNLFLSVDYGKNGGTGDDGAQRPWTRQDPPFYASNSIWLDPNATHTTEGATTFVKVRVSNKGNQAMTGVTVQAFIFEPHAGLPTPGASPVKLESSAKTVQPGGGSLTDSDPHVFTLGPWTPTDAQFPGEGEKHLCLIANVFQDPAEMDPPPVNPGDAEGNRIASDGTFKPNEDQHQGQRNITLHKVQQASLSQPARVPYSTYPPPPPPSDFPRQMLVSAEPVPHSDLLGPAEFFVLSSLGETEMLEREGNDPELALRTSWGREPVRLSTAPMSFELKAEGIPGLGRTFQMDNSIRKVVPSELEVRLDPDAPVGSLHAFDVTLREDGEVVGSGLRVLLLVTE